MLSVVGGCIKVCGGFVLVLGYCVHSVASCGQNLGLC